MKAKFINTDNTPHGNAIQLPMYGNAPMLFLEFIARERHEIRNVQKFIAHEIFIIHFYPAKEPNVNAVKYINANL